MKVSGLSKWFGQQLIGLQVLPPFAIMIIVKIDHLTVHMILLKKLYPYFLRLR